MSQRLLFRAETPFLRDLVVCVQDLPAATGKSSLALCPPGDMRQRGGSSQVPTATQGQERPGLLPLPTWKPKIKSELWEEDAVDGPSPGTEPQNHRENQDWGLKRLLAPREVKKTPAWERSRSAGLLGLFLNWLSSPKVPSKQGHFISTASSSGWAGGMGSICQGMDQKPQEHPAVLQGDVRRLGSFQLPAARGGSPSPPAPTAESGGPDKVLQTEVPPADKEMKSLQSLLSTASSPVAPAHPRGLSSQTMLSELIAASSPQAEPMPVGAARG